MRKLYWFMSVRVPCATLASANCLLVAATLLIATAITAQSQEEVIKFDVSLVTVSVAVKDHKGRALVGLKPADFLVTDENTPVSPEFFESDGPASIVFVIDTSSSMSGAKWKSLFEGLKSFLKKSRVDNDYTLIAFHSRAFVVAESVSAAELFASMNALKPNGETALYDGVMLGLEALKRTQKRNKALVLISDGEDNSSRTKLSDVEMEAFSRRATIYSVGVMLKDYCERGIIEACKGKETIKQLAGITGGVAFFPDESYLARALKEISNEVNNHYSLSYYPPDKNAGWRRVQVSVASADRTKLRYQQRYLMR
jgi:Ca-activated chloride channel homolog